MAIDTQTSASYEGFETWTTAFRMSIKMHAYVFFSIVFLHLIVSTIAIFILIKPYPVKATMTWVVAKTVSLGIPTAGMNFENQDGTKTHASVIHIANDPRIKSFALSKLKRSTHILTACGLIYFLYPVVLRFFRGRSKNQTDRRHVRGASLITELEFNRSLNKDGQTPDLPFGEIRMPKSSEVKHTFIVGRPGTGKTVLISQILERLKERNERAIVYDFKGDYLSKFYDPKCDLIFNPLDTRSLGWRIMNEIKTYMDIDAVSSSLIPPSIASSDPFWNDAARDVLAGIFHYLFQNRFKTNAEIWNMVTAEGYQIAKNLKNTIGGERGHRYIEDAGSKQALSVFSVLMQYAKCFEYMSQNDGDFSVRRWLKKGEGMIFITNYADVQDTLKPVLSLFIDLLGRRLLSMEDDPDRRVFFLLDEFGTLQRLSTIIKLLTLSRSKGGSVFLGIQDFGQLDRIYSREHKQSIVNACGNSAIFSVADTVTAKYCSDKIGETEYTEAEKTLSIGVEDFRDGTSLSMRRKKEPLFLPSDIMNLPELSCIVKFSNYPSVLSQLTYKGYQNKTPGFDLRDDLLLAGLNDSEVRTNTKKSREYTFEGIG